MCRRARQVRAREIQFVASGEKLAIRIAFLRGGKGANLVGAFDKSRARLSDVSLSSSSCLSATLTDVGSDAATPGRMPATPESAVTVANVSSVNAQSTVRLSLPCRVRSSVGIACPCQLTLRLRRRRYE